MSLTPPFHRAFPIVALVSTAIVGITGCSVSTNDPNPPAQTVVVEPTNPPTASTLTVRWTITGSIDPNECAKSVSSEIEIIVRDLNGVEVGAFRQACTAFATSITLNPGSYSGSAALLDGAGQPRTTDVQIAPFTLRGNDEIDIPLDFPSDSFF